MLSALPAKPAIVNDFPALSAAVSPAWHQAVIRLASAPEQVACRLELWIATNNREGNFVREARNLAKDLIGFLDEVDGDPDLEPSLGYGWRGGDDREQEDEHDEPSLGWTDREAMRGHYSGISATGS
jgi:hypothetical protein